MNIIDIHTHIYPSAIARKAADSVRDFYGLGNDAMDGSKEMLLQKGTEAGISHYLILPVALRPDRVRHINEFIVDAVSGERRFTGFGTVHAGMEDLMGEVAFITAKGLRGIKMHPDSQGFAIDDPRLFPVYEAVSGRLPVLFHMGDQRYDYSHPARLRRLLELFPRLQVLAAHFGGYSMYETAYELLHDKDCIFDISSSMMFMDAGVAEKYINAYGAERMAYGTDFPMWDPVDEVSRFQQLKLTDEQFEQISHKTAQRFLGL